MNEVTNIAFLMAKCSVQHMFREIGEAEIEAERDKKEREIDLKKKSLNHVIWKSIKKQC